MSYKQRSPLPITEGGTNTQSFVNAFGIAYYDGGSLNTIAPGTAGHVLTSNGASPASFQPASGGGGFTWNNTTTATQAMAVSNGYVSNNGVTLVTFTLPATATVGQIIAVQGSGSGLFTIAQNASQTIHFNAVNSTTGVTGSVSSTSQYDSIMLICNIANTDWVVNQSTGNLSVV